MVVGWLLSLVVSRGSLLAIVLSRWIVQVPCSYKDWCQGGASGPTSERADVGTTLCVSPKMADPSTWVAMPQVVLLVDEIQRVLVLCVLWPSTGAGGWLKCHWGLELNIGDNLVSAGLGN